MKSTLYALIFVLSAPTAFGKQLVIACEKDGAPDVMKASMATVGATLEIANINAEPVIQSLSISGTPEKRARVISKKISKVEIELDIQFGSKLYSSASLQLKDCSDSFSATGTGTLKTYVGGFAGTSQSQLQCSCELK